MLSRQQILQHLEYNAFFWEQFLTITLKEKKLH